MKIAFYYSFPLQKDWNGADLEGDGLAGSETALVHMARELAGSHQVHVFNRTSAGTLDHGVRFWNQDDLPTGVRWDVFVVVRGPAPDPASVRADIKVYWSIEEDRSQIRDWGQALRFFDAVFTVSAFHTERLAWRCGVPRHRIYETRLGINPVDYAETLPKVPYRLIYCSVPGKGLAHLAGIYREVQKEIPAVSLVITGDYTLWGRGPDDERHRALFRGLDGVEYLGRVPRKELVKLQKTSVLHVHPCVVEELFCLPSLECQAAATPSVCSDLGALPTTVEDGRSGSIVRARFDSSGFHAAFASEVSGLLRSPDVLSRMADYARERALTRFSYDIIASEWLKEFETLRNAAG